MKCPPAPDIELAQAPCPDCGAQTEDEAENICKPKTDETGERYCAGEFDLYGRSVVPTPESLKKLDSWFADHCNCEADVCHASRK